MKVVSRGTRVLAVALLGAGALAATGCGEGQDTPENTPTQVRQENALPDSLGSPLVDDVQPPTAEVTSPAGGSFLRGTVTVTANATDDVGVARVDFFDGTSLIGSATQAPFAVNWITTSVTPGTHSLTAQAFDVAGNSGTSSAVSVVVDNTAPALYGGLPQYNPTNQNYVRGIVTVSWSVGDGNGSGVALAEFLRDGVVVASTPGDGSSSYSFSWDTRVLGNRAYTVSIRATDKAGNVGTSMRTLIVDNTLPSSILTAPANGAQVSGVVTLSANASDNLALAYVRFEIDGVMQTPFSTTAPYTRSWDTTGKSGTHTIVAIAMDRAGNTRQSSTVTVTVP